MQFSGVGSSGFQSGGSQHVGSINFSAEVYSDIRYEKPDYETGYEDGYDLALSPEALKHLQGG